MRRSHYLFLIIFISLGLISLLGWVNALAAAEVRVSHATQAICTWNGSTGNWNTAGNWDCASAERVLRTGVTQLSDWAVGGASIPKQGEADLTVQKTANVNETVAGEVVTYTLTVTNLGPDIATGVRVTDTLPSEAVFLSTSGDCTETDGVVSCQIGTLEVDASAEILIAIEAWSLTTSLANTANVAGEGSDPNTLNNLDIHTMPITTSADLALEVTHTAPMTVTMGMTFTYDLNLTNLGPGSALSVTLTGMLPTGMDLQSVIPVEPPDGNPNCSESGGTITCKPGNLGVNGHLARSHRLRIGMIVIADEDNVDPDGFEASASSLSPDPDSSNNSSGFRLFLPHISR